MTNRNFRQIINLLDLRWQRRVPVIHQTEGDAANLLI